MQVFIIFLVCFCLQFSGLRMPKIRDIDFLLKQLADWLDCAAFVEPYGWDPIKESFPFEILTLIAHFLILLTQAKIRIIPAKRTLWSMLSSATNLLRRNRFCPCPSRPRKVQSCRSFDPSQWCCSRCLGWRGGALDRARPGTDCVELRNQVVNRIFQTDANQMSALKMWLPDFEKATGRKGRIQEERLGRSLPTHESNFIHHNFCVSENSIDDKGHFVVHGIITAMGVGRGGAGAKPPWILKMLAKKG